MPAPDSILIVDDDAEIRSLLGGNLENSGYRVKAVADGRGRRAALKGAQPDIVILDLMLPGEDGLAWC
jgi:two-component system, OmpR family, response regulator